VVDDDEDARVINRAMLELHGASVVVASGAYETLLLLLTVCPDALVVDLRMPEMDGFQLVRRLRADPHWRHLPIVALSALGSDADYLHTFQDGFDAHVTKPADDAVLAAVVDRVIRARRGA
jgi:two-component system CheB/CheR fusion protein